MADPSSEKPAGQGLTPRAAAGETCCSEHDPSQSAGSSQSGDPTDPRNPRPISYQTGSGGEMYAVQQVRVRDGVVIKGADGDIFFLRQEVLEAMRVTEPEMRRLLEEEAGKQYQQDSGRFNVNLGPLQKAVPLRGPFDPPRFDARAASTIMCPGNCRSVAYIVPDDEF